MEKSGGNSPGFHADFCENFSDSERMFDVVFSGLSFLSSMRFVCKCESGRDEPPPFA